MSRLPVAWEGRQAAKRLPVDVEPLQDLVGERHHLAQEGVGPDELVEGISELGLLVVAQLSKADQHGVDVRVDGLEEPLGRVDGEVGVGGGLDLLVLQDAERQHPSPEVVEDIDVGLLDDDAFVVLLEGCLNGLGFVAEVEDERGGLAGSRTVQARERLDGVSPLSFLSTNIVWRYGSSKPVWYFSATMRTWKSPGLYGSSPLNRLAVWDSGNPFSEVSVSPVDLAGERHEGVDVVVLVLLDVMVDGPLVPDRRRPGVGHDHGLGSASQLLGSVLRKCSTMMAAFSWIIVG